jgi:hypothetical protein
MERAAQIVENGIGLEQPGIASGRRRVRGSTVPAAASIERPPLKWPARLRLSDDTRRGNSTNPHNVENRLVHVHSPPHRGTWLCALPMTCMRRQNAELAVRGEEYSSAEDGKMRGARPHIV